MTTRGRAIAILSLVFMVVAGEALAVTSARRFIENGRFSDARARLTTLLETNPGNGEIQSLLASLEFDGMRSQEIYRKALVAEDKSGVARAFLGIAEYYFARGFYSSAERMARRVIDQYPLSDHAPWARLIAGRCLLNTGDPGEASSELAPLLVSPDTRIQDAAAGAWALANLKVENSHVVIQELKRDRWRSNSYLQGILAKAYRASGKRRTAQRVSGRAATASARWASSRSVSRIRAIPTSAPSPSTPTPAVAPTRPVGSSGGYALQVGTFGNAENVRRLVAKYRDGGFRVSVRQTGRLRRVLVGSYATRDDARADIPRVRAVAKGLNPVPVSTR